MLPKFTPAFSARYKRIAECDKPSEFWPIVGLILVVVVLLIFVWTLLQYHPGALTGRQR